MWVVGSKPTLTTSSCTVKRLSPTRASILRRSSIASPYTAACRITPSAHSTHSSPSHRSPYPLRRAGKKPIRPCSPYSSVGLTSWWKLDASSTPPSSVWSNPHVTSMPPPQLRNQPRPSGSAYHGATTPVGESQASERPLNSHRPTSSDRSTSTSNAKLVPVRNSRTRTPRSRPSPSVARRTPATCSRRPTRRISSRRVIDLPLTKGITVPSLDSDLRARSRRRDSRHRQIVLALAEGCAGGLEPLVTLVRCVVDEEKDANQQPATCDERRLGIRVYRAVLRRAKWRE